MSFGTSLICVFLFVGALWLPATSAIDEADLVLDDMVVVAKRPNRNIEKQSNGSISLRELNVLSIANAFRENPDIEINFDVAFAKNSKVLTANGRSVVDMLALVLNYIGEEYQFEIRGHTDSIGNREWKKKLSEGRAQAIAGLLRNNYSITNQLTALGFADTRPIVSNSAGQGELVNERITIVNRGVGEHMAADN